jgi:hypothetical protein
VVRRGRLYLWDPGASPLGGCYFSGFGCVDRVIRSASFITNREWLGLPQLGPPGVPGRTASASWVGRTLFIGLRCPPAFCTAFDAPPGVVI